MQRPSTVRFRPINLMSRKTGQVRFLRSTPLPIEALRAASVTTEPLAHGSTTVTGCCPRVTHDDRAAMHYPAALNNPAADRRWSIPRMPLDAWLP
jgi:hypothetical protein